MELRTVQVFIASALVLAGAIVFTRKARAEPTPDEQVIAQLKKAGSDLSKSHAIEFYLYFQSQEAASSAAERVKNLGFAIVRVDPAASGPGWLLLASKGMVPTKAAMAEIRARLDAIAKAGNGEYDGWEAEVTK